MELNGLDNVRRGKLFYMQVVINLSVSNNIFYISNPQLLIGVFGLKLGRFLN